MAELTKQVPKTSDQVFFHFSHPIPQPDFRVGTPVDTASAAIEGQAATIRAAGGVEAGKANELSGVGTLLSETAASADETIKSFASAEVQDRIRGERDREIAALAGAKESLTGQPTDLPSDIKNIGKRVDVLQNARANGTISETDYYGRLMKTASDIRSHYGPGYREYVDQQIKQITGQDPANAYIKSVIGDINNTLSQANKEQEHLLRMFDTMIIQGQHDGSGRNAAAMRECVVSGQCTQEQGRAWINDTMGYKADADRARDRFAVTEANSKEQEKAGEDLATTLIFGAQDQFNNTRRLRSGITRDKEGRIQLDQNQINERSKELAITEQDFRTAMAKQYNSPVQFRNPVTGAVETKPLNQIIKPEKWKELVDNAASGWQREQILMQGPGGFALAKDTERMVERIHKDFELKMLSNPEIRNFDLAMEYIQKRYGSGPMADFMRAMLKNNFDLSTKMQDALTVMLTTSIASDHPESLDTQASKYAKIGADENAQQALIDAWVGEGTGLMSPTALPGQKRKAVDVLFSPENNKYINKLKSDFYDDQGNFHPGAESVFEKLSAPEVGEEIKKLNDPNAFKKWQSWVETNFRTIFIRDMKELESLPGVDKKQIGWDNENHKLIAPKGSVGGGFGPTGEPLGKDPTQVRVERTMDTINRGLANVANIPRSINFDVNVYLHNLLRDMGALPEGEDMTDKLIRAIDAAHPPAPRPQPKKAAK